MKLFKVNKTNQLKELFHNRIIIRYLLVGGMNTAFSFSVYSLFVLFGIHYSVSNFLALVFGIIFSYITNGKFVFRHLSRGAIVRYVIIWGLPYMLQLAIISLVMSLGGGVILGGGVALIITVPASFVLQKYFVFNI